MYCHIGYKKSILIDFWSFRKHCSSICSECSDSSTGITSDYFNFTRPSDNPVSSLYFVYKGISNDEENWIFRICGNSMVKGVGVDEVLCEDEGL